MVAIKVITEVEGTFYIRTLASGSKQFRPVVVCNSFTSLVITKSEPCITCRSREDNGKDRIFINILSAMDELQRLIDSRFLPIIRTAN